ncbi:TOMM precursor leader peptide-binding protein [Kitasatospora sp. NPDC059571]|uniref:TOMM precursor leader peptide-binding protein n=1 Tax=Kitasatospora sp. NPDC059571 TaxID=3346871 RepID=UPI0036C4EBB6
MTAVYDEIAGTRPRIRRDVLFTETPTGVLFRNSRGGFAVNSGSAYRFASLLVPHLNGEKSVVEICAGLGEKQRDLVAQLVSTLYERGFARHVPPGSDGLDALPAAVAARFTPQIDYIDHYTGGAGERFLRFRTARVAVLGTDEVAAWCALGLVRNGIAAVAVPAAPAGGADPFAEAAEEARLIRADGCPVELVRLDGNRAHPDGGGLPAGYELVVASEGPHALLGMLTAGIPEGTRLLPAWTFGGQAVVGPLTGGSAPGCWACAALRLGSGPGAAGAAAELWRGAGLGGGPRPRPGRPLAAMIGNLLAYEVFRLTTGAPAAETEGRVLLQDLDSLDVAAEPLLPHPHCPFCRPEQEPAAGPAPQEPAVASADAAADRPDALVAAAADGDDGEAVLAGLESRAVLVQPHAGVFTAYADDDWEQTPLKVATVRLGTGPGAVREVSAFDVHHVAGARVRALHRAAEVYAHHVLTPDLLPSTARPAGPEPDLPRVDPARLSTASGSGAPAGSWTIAHSLLDGAAALVPTAAVHPFGAANRDRICLATAAGTGAGASPAAAAARGLLTALSLQALLAAVRGTAEVTAVQDGADLAAAAGEERELAFLLRSAKTLGLAVDLLDLGAGGQAAPVLLARTEDPATGRARWAVGSALTARRAAVDALRDLLGQVQLEQQQPGAADPGDPLLGDFDPRTLTPSGPSALPADGPAGWPVLLERLSRRGDEALVVRTGSADLRAAGVHVARVVLVPAVARDR